MPDGPVGPEEEQIGATKPKEDLPLSEKRIEMIHEQMRVHFPEFPDMDRGEYDAYNPEEDKLERGQILKFFSEKGRMTENPQVWFIYLDKKGGFVITYYNTSPLKDAPNSGYNGDSVAGPQDERWKDSQIDLALMKARIRYEGIDTSDQKLLERVKNSPPITMENISRDNVETEAYRSIFADKGLLPPVSKMEPPNVFPVVDETSP